MVNIEDHLRKAAVGFEKLTDVAEVDRKVVRDISELGLGLEAAIYLQREGVLQLEEKTEGSDFEPQIPVKGSDFERLDVPKYLNDGALFVCPLETRDVVWGYVLVQHRDGQKVPNDSFSQDLHEYIEVAAAVADAITQRERHVADLRGTWDFARSAAHDINQPLSTLNMAAYVLKRAAEKAIQRREPLDPNMVLMQGSLIEKEVAYCSGITDSLLQFSKQGESLINPVEIALSDLFESVESSYQDKLLERGVGIVHDLQVPTLHADESILRRVYSNLIHNMAKYSDVGKAYVYTKDYGSSVLLAVENPIDGEPLSRGETILLRGHAPSRLDRNKEMSRTGLGIGLANCRTFVEAHGGSLKIPYGYHIEGVSYFSVQMTFPKQESAE